MAHQSDQSTTKRQSEREQSLLAAISRAQEHVIQNADTQQLFSLLLHDFIALTGSEFGFIGTVDHRPNGTPYLRTQAISNIAWDKHSLELYDKYANENSGPLEFDNLDNLFGAVITTGKTIIINDAKHDPRSKSLPKGYPKLDTFLGLPVYCGEKLVGMVGVANCSSGYEEAIADYLQPLLKTYAQIIAFLKKNQQLRDSEQRFRVLAENAADAIFVHDREGKFIDSNHQACESLGYSHEELVRLSVLDISKKTTSADIENIWQRLEKGESVNFESEHYRKDGSHFPVDINMARIQSGDKALVLALARDITHAKEAEGKLHQAIAEMEQRVKERTVHLTRLSANLQNENDSHLKTHQELTLERDFIATIFETIAAPIIVLDPQGRILKLNRACESVLGFNINEVQGKTFWHAFICDGERDAVQDQLIHAVENGIDEELHTNCWHAKEGQTRLLSWSHANLYDGDGKTNHLIVTGIDITEQYEAESKLRENVRQLNTLDHISNISMKASSLEQMLSEILDEMLYIFNCDRVWLLFPCDPNAPTWSVPMERVRPGWPGANAQGLEIEMTRDAKETFLNALHQDVVTYDQNSKHSVPIGAAEDFNVLAQMDCALFPKLGKPWLLGLHHCQEQHNFIPEERRIFKQIAERLEQSLTNLLILRNLNESESKYRELYENMAQGVIYHDREGNVISANPSAEKILGLSLAQMQERASLYPRWHSIHQNGGDFPEEGHPAIIALQTGKPVIDTVMGIFNPRTEKTHWLTIGAIPQFKNGDKTPHQVFTTFSDITERKLAEDKLRLSATAVENSGDAILIGDAAGNLIAINKAYQTMTGFSESEVIDKPVQISSINPSKPDVCHTIMDAISEQGQWQGEILLHCKNGDTIPAWSNVSAVYDDQGRLSNCVSVATDISVIKKSQQQLDFLAYHDPLTNLPNRLLLDDRLNHALQRARREQTQAAVLFLDLDRFKNINDSLGHPVGDKLLKQVALRLRDLVRNNDTVARLGGDEFVLIVEEIDEAIDLATLAQKIIAELSRPIKVKDYVLHLTTSIGISIYPSDGQDPETLIKNADAAMYRAKEEGRNGYHFYTMALTNAVYEHLTMETALRHALDNDELVLHYQPQIDASTNKLIGVEALVRWNHPDLGLVYPDKFINMAEESGLIIPLGEWVIWTACRQMQEWDKQGVAPQKITLNLSGVQFYRGAIVETIKRILNQVRLSPTRLELEITESVIMEKTERTIETMNQLREMGVCISIDDFGTGYSSLSYLKRMPVDKLKIDQSFIRDLSHDSNDEAIATAIIALANSMQLEVLAQGVETAEQRDHLLRLGCNLFQGHLFSVPLNTRKMNNYMNEHVS